MSSVTPNYSLNKPAYTDFADVAELNDNMDVIDTALKAHDDILATVPVANGGTGATTASGARTNLGLGSVATENTVPVGKGGTGATTVAGARNALGLGNTSGALPIANGGTGATSASAARTALGLGSVATENTVPVSKGGTGATTVAGARNALGLGNTSGALPVANGGTGATSASAARTNLGLGAVATKDTVPIANGGTNATTVAGARNNLGLGNTSGALPVANGGTGATTASGARTNLGAAASSILNETNTSGTNNNISWAAYKSGKTVMLKFATGSGGLSSNVAQNTSFFTVTSGYRPVSLAYFAVRYDTGFQVGTVGTDGTVKMSTSAATSGKGFYGTATYLTE